MYNLNFYEAWQQLEKNDSVKFSFSNNIITESEDASPEVNNVTEEAVQEVNKSLEKPEVKADLKRFVERVQQEEIIELIDSPNSPDAALIEEAKKASGRFGRTKSAWAAQLQLLANAYISETEVLKLINSGQVQQVFDDYKLLSAVSVDTANTVADFNKADNHNVVFDTRDEENKSAPRNDIDVMGTNKNGEQSNVQVEIKAVKDDVSSAAYFHNADIIFIVAINKDKDGGHPVYVRYKLNSKEEASSKAIQKIFGKAIKTKSDGASIYTQSKKITVLYNVEFIQAHTDSVIFTGEFID